MDPSEDVFKPPSLPAMPPPSTAPSSSSSSTSTIAFKLPQSKKLSTTESNMELSLDDDSGGEKEVQIAQIERKPAMDLKEENDKTDGEKSSEKKSVSTKAPTPIASDYKPPVWAGPCKRGTYDLDVLKDGRIVGSISLASASIDEDEDDEDKNDQTRDPPKTFFVFGRFGDVVVEHPSISRHHAVLQHRALGNAREIGWYLYDMGSTHGTHLNKEKLAPWMYVPIRVGHMFKLGYNSRMYILNGPEEDREPESNMSITELKEQAHKQKLLMAKRREPAPASIGEDEQPETEKKDESDEALLKTDEQQKPAAVDEGISWGMSDDYGEDEEDEKKQQQQEEEENEGESAMVSIEEMQKREQLYVDDPKKALKNWFERQGGSSDEMQFDYSERGGGARHQWTCRIELPVENETGRPMVAEAATSGGKKEAMAACALEACRMLDAAGLLRKSNQDSKKRKSKEWADNDYYDSDEDTFLDRTGDVEKKRAKRIRQAVDVETEGGSKTSTAETFDSLTEKLRAVNAEIERAQQQHDLLKAEAQDDDARPNAPAAAAPSSSSITRDSLDAYMATMSRRDPHESKIHQSRLRLKLIELRKSAERLEKLVKLAKPTSLPPIVIKKTLDAGDATKKKQPILIGSMKGHRMRKLNQPTVEVEQPTETPSMKQRGLKDEEIEEVEEETEKNESIKPEQPKKPEKSPAKATARRSTDDGNKIYSVSPPPPPAPIEREEEPEETMDTEETPAVEEESTTPKQTKKPRPRNKKNAKGQDANKEASYGEYDARDVNYATWLPPENQSGDGRTSLNEKFGY